jgi:hypothetical protein
MKRICLIGPVDKRAIAYPLIKCMMFLGKTLVVTDDSVFRRFSESYDLNFGLANAEFIITPVIDKTVLTHVTSVESSFDYILFLTTNELPPDCDKVLYCHGVEKGFCSSGVLKALENVEYTEVLVTFSKVTDTSVVKIEPSKSVMTYIFECEDKKEFVESADSSYASMVEQFFTKELDVPKKTLSGLMRRKG